MTIEELINAVHEGYTGRAYRSGHRYEIEKRDDRGGVIPPIIANNKGARYIFIDHWFRSLSKGDLYYNLKNRFSDPVFYMTWQNTKK